LVVKAVLKDYRLRQMHSHAVDKIVALIENKISMLRLTCQVI